MPLGRVLPVKFTPNYSVDKITKDLHWTEKVCFKQLKIEITSILQFTPIHYYFVITNAVPVCVYVCEVFKCRTI